MANEILNFCGWEHQDLLEASASATGSPAIDTTNQRSGTACLEISSTNAGELVGFEAHGDDTQGANPAPAVSQYSQANIVVGCAFRWTTHEADTAIFVLRAGAVVKASMQIINDAGDRKLRLANTSATTVVTFSTVLTQNTWYYVELAIGTGTSAAWEMHLNETTETASGTDDFNASNHTDVLIGYGDPQGSGLSSTYQYDDFYIKEGTTFLGDVKVGLLLANADGTDTAWTIASGSTTGTYTDVDDTPPHDVGTTILGSSTNTDAETVNFEPTSTISNVGTIHAVKVSLWSERDSSPVADMNVRVHDGATQYDSGVHDPTRNIYDADDGLTMTAQPSGGAWDSTAVDGLEGGIVHRQSQSRQINCTAVYCQVLYTVSVANVEVYPPISGAIRNRRFNNLQGMM